MAIITFDMSELARSSLQSVEKQLSSFEKSPENRFQCLYYNNEHKRYCEQSCKWFIIENPRLFKKAQDALELEQISTAEFSKIIRTLFCGWHNSTHRFTNYQQHFEKLWEKASRDIRVKILDAFRIFHKDIFEELCKEADMTTEERKQVRDSLKTFKEDTNNTTEQSPIAQRSFQDPGTPSQQHPRVEETETERIIDGGLLSADMPTLPQTPQQHSQDRLSARPKLTPRSRSPRRSIDITPASQRFDTRNGIPENLSSVSADKKSIFDIIRARLNLNPPSQEHPTPPPAEKEKPILSNQAELPCPGDRAYDLSSFGAVLPIYNAKTSSELGTEAIPKFRTYFPVHEMQTSGPRTPDWKNGTDKARSNIKPLGSGRNTPSPFSLGWTSDAGATTRKDRSPSRPITNYLNPFEGPKNIPNPPSPAFSARPLAESGMRPFGRPNTDHSLSRPFTASPQTESGMRLFRRPDADRSLSRPCTASPNPIVDLEGIRNSLSPAISEPSQSDPGPEPVIPAERLRTVDSPLVPRNGEARLNLFTRPVPLISLSPKQDTNTFSNELRVERPERLTQEIRSLLLQPIFPALATVYILKAPNYFKNKVPCVKIGITKNVTQRLINLSTTCGFTDLSECQESDAVAIPRELAARVEKLCHMELSPFRKIMKCEKGGNGAKHTVSHEEWFAVSEQVAVQTVKRWLKFIELMPYHGQEKYSELSGIRDNWQKPISELKAEKTADWGIRHGELSGIYDKWIEDAKVQVLLR